MELQKALQRVQGQLADARRRAAKRQARRWNRQCYALGSAVEAAIRTRWSTTELAEFLEFARDVFPADSLVTSLRGVVDSNPLSPKAANLRWIRWGVVAHRMIQSGRLPPQELEDMVNNFLGPYIRSRALTAIEDARKKIVEVLQNGNTRKADEAASNGNAAFEGRPADIDVAPNSARRGVVAAEANARNIRPRRRINHSSASLPPKESLLDLGEMVEVFVGTSRSNLQFFTQLMDPYHDRDYQWVGRRSLEALELGQSLEEPWRGAAHLAWGRALYNCVRSSNSSDLLIRMAHSLPKGDFRIRLLSAIHVARQTARVQPTTITTNTR